MRTANLQQSPRTANLEQRPGEPEITTFRPPFVPNIPTLNRKPKQFDVEGEDNSFDVEFIDDGFLGVKYLGFFSSRSLKTREKCIGSAQLVLLSLYIFLGK